MRRSGFSSKVEVFRVTSVILWGCQDVKSFYFSCLAVIAIEKFYCVERVSRLELPLSQEHGCLPPPPPNKRERVTSLLQEFCIMQSLLVFKTYTSDSDESDALFDVL